VQAGVSTLQVRLRIRLRPRAQPQPDASRRHAPCRTACGPGRRGHRTMQLLLQQQATRATISACSLRAVGCCIMSFRAILGMMRPQPDASKWRNSMVVTRIAGVASQYSRPGPIEFFEPTSRVQSRCERRDAKVCRP
jgi:hypothetical protein